MENGLFPLLENFLFLLSHITGSKSAFPRPLPAAEEAALIAQNMTGDMQARRRLIEHNLRLVAHIVKKFTRTGIDSDDLVSIGTIGLMKAVETFRPEAGKLTTYASRCIENEILMQLRAGKKNRRNVSLNDPIGADKDGNEIFLIDLLGTEGDIVAEQADLNIEAARARKLVFSVLEPREQQVITLRYGLADGELHPQHAVAAALGISRSYVSRIEKKALEKLRDALTKPEQRPTPRGDFSRS